MQLLFYIMPYQCKYRGFKSRYKPLVTLKNMKARFEFDKKHIKQSAQFCNIWTDETKMELY